MNILIVDDEELIRNVIKEYSNNEGYNIYEAENGLEAIDIVKKYDINLVVLDIMMPKLDGYKACEEIKKIKDIPIIMLSARKEEFDKLTSFELGVDDYITKPFSPKELMARIKAISKRNKKGNIFRYEDLVIDYMGHTVSIDDNELQLTPKEYEILCFLVDNKNIAISREMILNKLWGYSFYGDERTIDTHIKKLRNSLGKYRDLITTVRGMGYKFEIKK